MTPTFPLLAHAADEETIAWTEQGPRRVDQLLIDSAVLARHIPDAPAPGREGGHEVLVLCGDRYNFVVSVLAAWQRGLAVALPPHTQPGAIKELMRGEGIRALFHDGHAERGVDVRPLIGTGSGDTDAVRAALRIPGDRVLASVYTSGTSGERQRYRKVAAQLLGEAATLAQLIGAQRDDRILATVPSHHIYGFLTGVLIPLTTGASFVSAAPLYPEDVAETVRNSEATIIASVPVHLRGLATIPGTTLNGLRRVLSSGAPLDRATAIHFAETGRELFEILGSSETGGVAWRNTAREESWHPLPGVRVEADRDGRMLVSSPFLDPAWSRPFLSGDAIEPETAGTFRHLGRMDGVVKVGGKRVLLADMEYRLRSLKGVTDAAVAAVAVETGSRGNEIWAAVASTSLDGAAIRRALSAWFEPVALPRRIRVLERLPRESTGKLPRKALLEIFDPPGPPAAFEVLDRTWDDGTMRVVPFRVPLDLLYFRGHFDGFPILAGVVVLNNLVLPESRLAWPTLRGLRELDRLKFHRGIFPGEALTLSLRRHADRVTFDVRNGDQVSVSGTLGFEATA